MEHGDVLKFMSAMNEDSTSSLPVHAPASASRLHHRSIADRLYGDVRLPAVLWVFINSPEMQRLRGIMQLGNVHYVYPSATNTRFEHCLGVAHLSMTFLKQLIENHAEAQGYATNPFAQASARELERDIWCVGIAGLCHDIGHGPLSHAFERFVNRAAAAVSNESEDSNKSNDAGDVQPAEPTRWSHERGSELLVNTIWARHRELLGEYGLSEKDCYFVQLLIRGLDPREEWPAADVGRPAWKRFMTDIVANKRSGLDVDKLDYIQRDSLSCFGVCPLQFVERLFHGALLCQHEGKTEICYEEKLDDVIEEIFLARARLYRRVYLHRVVSVIDQMTLDALLLADAYVTRTIDGRSYRLSEWVFVPELYIMLGEWLISDILFSPDPRLMAARHILGRIQRRDLYRVIGYWSDGCKNEAPVVTQDELLSEITDDGLVTAVRSWQAANSLPAMQIIDTTFTLTASGMDATTNPLQQILYYNRRVAEGLTPHFYSRSRSMHILDMLRPEKRYIVVTRMQVNDADMELLCEAYRRVMDRYNIDTYIDHSQTPNPRVSATPRSHQRSRRDDAPPQLTSLSSAPSSSSSTRDAKEARNENASYRQGSNSNSMAAEWNSRGNVTPPPYKQRRRH